MQQHDRRLERARHLHQQQKKRRVEHDLETKEKRQIAGNGVPVNDRGGAVPIDDGFTLTGPITITVFVPPTPEATEPAPAPPPITTDDDVPPPAPPVTSNTPPPPPVTTTNDPIPPVTSVTTSSTSIPSVVVSSSVPGGGNGNGNGNNGNNNGNGNGNGNNNNNNNPNGNQAPSTAGALASSNKLSTGAIVGIVIAILVVLSGAAVFFLRRKNVFARKRRRATWLSKGGIMGPKPISGYDTFLPTSNEKPPPPPAVPQADFAPQFNTYNDAGPGDNSPGVAFARAQDRAMEGIALPQESGYPSYYNTAGGGGGGSNLNGGAAAAAALASLAAPQQSYLNNNAPNPTNTIVSTVPSAYSGPGNVSPPPLGESATVVCTFIPTLPDELNITTGEVVTILQSFDDGWTQCVSSRGEQGMVPLECLDRSAGYRQQAPVDARDYRRASSLASASAPGTLQPNRFFN